MFGLMKNNACLQAGKESWYKHHYCGTCKTIGKIYGQGSRTLLNHDAVFLSEILTLLQGGNTRDWDENIQKDSCFELPDKNNIPLSLEYASDINLLLAKIKFEDNALDDVQQIWKWGQRFFKNPFDTLETQLNKWNIDSLYLQKYLDKGLNKEYEEYSNPDIKNRLVYFSESTAEITAYLFAKGAEIINKKEIAETLSKIGFSFGQLIYVLDAWKDYDEDSESGNFNPLLFNHIDKTDAQNKTEEFIWQILSKIELQFETIPLEKEILDNLKSRLFMNVSIVLNKSEKTACSSFSSGIEKATIPTFFRTTKKILKQGFSWVNPAVPLKFTSTYIILLILFFQQQISNAAVSIQSESFSLGTMDYLLFLGLASLPLFAYLAVRKIPAENFSSANISKKLKRKKKRLLRKLKWLSRLWKKRRKLKWWAWLLIVIGSIVVLLLLLILLLAVGIANADCNCG